VVPQGGAPDLAMALYARFGLIFRFCYNNYIDSRIRIHDFSLPTPFVSGRHNNPKLPAGGLSFLELNESSESTNLQ
jgi:hypothetical protein